ncbi:hypothetical protein VNO78_06611 [Psophocarpus tetragonolobus]|uniref:Uncharacterized protein n=1 Tax=Psophocarpus tetragonolobus TaxID=3891 RepID=A0AAN9STV3_PSOTE
MTSNSQRFCFNGTALLILLTYFMWIPDPEASIEALAWCEDVIGGSDAIDSVVNCDNVDGSDNDDNNEFINNVFYGGGKGFSIGGDVNGGNTIGSNVNCGNVNDGGVGGLTIVASSRGYVGGWDTIGGRGVKQKTKLN